MVRSTYVRRRLRRLSGRGRNQASSLGNPVWIHMGMSIFCKHRIKTQASRPQEETSDALLCISYAKDVGALIRTSYEFTSKKRAAIFGGNGAPGRIRTPNLLIRSQVLYPVELRARRRGQWSPMRRARKLLDWVWGGNWKIGRRGCFFVAQRNSRGNPPSLPTRRLYLAAFCFYICPVSVHPGR